MLFSRHFEQERADEPDRREITLEMCEQAVDSYVHRKSGRYDRTLYWSRVEGNDRVRYLRVVVEPDGEEIVTANFNRGYRRKAKRGDRPG